MLRQGLAFDRRHIILTNASHAALGFGLALILQDWVAGSVFLPVWVGWILVAFSLIVHGLALTINTENDTSHSPRPKS